MTRLYQKTALNIAQELTLDEAASHHLAVVLRAKIRDKIAIFNGDGWDYEAIILTINKKKIMVNVLDRCQKNTESKLNLHLAQGIARGEKMDFIMQKAVELGVKSITPLISARSNMRLSTAQGAKKMEHWQAIIESACGQSGRATLPLLHPIQPLSTWITHTSGLRFVLSPHANAPLPQTISTPEITLLIGPEGGLSPEEIELAISKQFQLLKLGKRVLRTETATIAALAILQHQFGDM